MMILQSGSFKIWVFFIGVYWVFIVIYYLLWRVYKKVFFLCNMMYFFEVFCLQQYIVFVWDIFVFQEYEKCIE